MYQGTVQDTSANSAKVLFLSHHGREEFTLSDSKDHEFILHPPVTAFQPEFYREASLSAPELLRTPSFFNPTPEKPLPPPPSKKRSLPCLSWRARSKPSPP